MLTSGKEEKIHHTASGKDNPIFFKDFEVAMLVQKIQEYKMFDVKQVGLA